MLLQCCKKHGKAFLSRIATGDETWVFHYTPESKAEPMTWKHPLSPGTKKVKTVQFPANVMANVFWDNYGVPLVNFTPSSSTINAAAYQGTLKETQRGY